MGMFTDMVFEEESAQNIPDYSILTQKLGVSGFTFPFMSGGTPATPTGPVDDYCIRVVGKELDDYWAYGSKVSGFTDSKKTDVRSYDKTQKYITGFDVNKDTYTNYVGATINGRTRITQQITSATTYVFDANNDVNIGTENQTTGIRYIDYTGQTRGVVDEFGIGRSLPLTTMDYIGEGWNETNTSLSALTKEEYLFGITQPPEVYSDVFIDRGDTTVFEKHLRLSEVESLEHLERYNNGFYRLVKQ